MPSYVLSKYELLLEILLLRPFWKKIELKKMSSVPEKWNVYSERGGIGLTDLAKQQQKPKKHNRTLS